MKTYTDSVLKIGKSHKICQDFIAHTENAVILSDGCSSSKDSETGAQLACKFFARYINGIVEQWFDIEYIRQITRRLKRHMDSLGLLDEALDVTLMILIKINDSVGIWSIGDGNIIILDKYQQLYRFYEIFHEPNMPCYLSYLIDEKRMRDYNAKKITKNLKFYNNKLELLTEYDYYSSTEFFTSQAICSESNTFLIASDGFNSFNSSNDIYQKVFDIFQKKTNMSGEFLTRKMKLVLEKLEGEGIYHLDDLSIGGLTVLEED